MTQTHTRAAHTLTPYTRARRSHINTTVTPSPSTLYPPSWLQAHTKPRVGTEYGHLLYHSPRDNHPTRSSVPRVMSRLYRLPIVRPVALVNVYKMCSAFENDVHKNYFQKCKLSFKPRIGNTHTHTHANRIVVRPCIIDCIVRMS